jgi:cyanophycin synthetase
MLDMAEFTCKEEYLLKKICETINTLYLLFLKPLDGNHGKGLSINVTNWEDAVSVCASPKNTINTWVSLRKIITGFEF